MRRYFLATKNNFISGIDNNNPYVPYLNGVIKISWLEKSFGFSRLNRPDVDLLMLIVATGAKLITIPVHLFFYEFSFFQLMSFELVWAEDFSKEK